MSLEIDEIFEMAELLGMATEPKEYNKKFIQLLFVNSGMMTIVKHHIKHLRLKVFVGKHGSQEHIISGCGAYFPPFHLNIRQITGCCIDIDPNRLNITGGHDLLPIVEQMYLGNDRGNPTFESLGEFIKEPKNMRALTRLMKMRFPEEYDAQKRRERFNDILGIRTEHVSKSDFKKITEYLELIGRQDTMSSTKINKLVALIKKNQQKNNGGGHGGSPSCI